MARGIRIHSYDSDSRELFNKRSDEELIWLSYERQIQALMIVMFNSVQREEAVALFKKRLIASRQIRDSALEIVKRHVLISVQEENNNDPPTE